jgi:Tfp pilus assembly ATPase PilU
MFTEIARPHGSPGFAAGSGMLAGKYLPPVALIGGMLAGVDASMDIKGKLKQRFITGPKQDAIIEDLAKNDEMLKQVPRNDLNDAFDTMKKITDNGASTMDKNLVRSFLRQSVAYDGVDYNTAKQMAETETAIKRTRQDDSPLANITRAVGSLATLTE